MKPVRPSPLWTMRSSSGKDFAAFVALKNSTMSGCPTADLSAATTASKAFELLSLKRSIVTFAAGCPSRKVRTWLTNISWCWNGAPCPESG